METQSCAEVMQLQYTHVAQNIGVGRVCLFHHLSEKHAVQCNNTLVLLQHWPSHGSLELPIQVIHS